MARDDKQQYQMPARQQEPGAGRLTRAPLGLGRESDFWTASPFQMMRRMQEDMDRVFGSFFGQPWGTGRSLAWGGEGAQALTGWAPNVDLTQPSNRGKLFWRVAAIDQGGNVGPFASGAFIPPPRPAVRCTAKRASSAAAKARKKKTKQCVASKRKRGKKRHR